VLNGKQREAMYDEARKANPELMFASDGKIEEYLADKFAEFVLDSAQEGVTDYYSDNRFSKFFQKITDAIRTIVRKLSGKQITPKYANIDKLFKDMYSGRYAYAKATKSNEDEFNKVFGASPAYFGYKSGDVVLADNARQYSEIFHDMLGRLVEESGLMTNTDGRVTANFDALKASYLSDLASYYQGMISLDNARTGKASGFAARFSEDDLVVAQVRLNNLIRLYENITKDEVWSEYEKILQRFISREFNLERDKNASPNAIANHRIAEKGDEDNTDETYDEEGNVITSETPAFETE
jgi:hypothetical protein